MSWKAYLVETTSGIASRSLDVSAFSWEDELNILSGGKATVQKESLQGLARPQYDVFQASLVLCYVRPDGEEVPWVGGPITGRPTETLETLEMTWGSIRAILAKRLALREDAVTDAQAKLAALIQVRKDVDAEKKILKTNEDALPDLKRTFDKALADARAAAGLTRTTGKSYFYFGTPPGSKNAYWIDRDDNSPHVWNGTTWVAKTSTAAFDTAKVAVDRRYDVSLAENRVKAAKDAVAAKTATAEALEADTEEDFNVRFSGTTLGEIAWSLVQLGQRKPGGRLPIVRGTPYENGTYSRTYEWWNLANLNIDRLLTDLSEMENGPDIHFRPRWADANQTRFEWVMVYGTQAQPVIAQDWAPDWDTTAAQNDIVDVTIHNDASAVVDRLYVTGNGSGAGTLISQATNLARVQTGRPFLEGVVSEPSQKDINVLRQRAHGRLSANREPFDQVTLEVRADSEKNLLGRWRVGDAAVVTIGEGWTHVPAGTYLMRIIKASGDLTENVTLEMQEDQWYPGAM